MANRYYSTKYNGNKVITWKNFTDTSTPLSAANLQKSHQAIQEIDTGVNSAFEAVDNTKMDKSACAGMITQVDYTPGTGVFVFHYFDTSIPDLVIDTNLEKVAVNFTYNPETQRLEILQADGTTVEVDLSAFVANPDLVNSDTIAWTVHSDGSLEANVRNGSITDEMIEAHYLASIMSIAGQVENDKETADYYALLSKSYAKGTSNLPDRPNENVDNSYHYMTQSQGYSVISGSYMNIAGNHASNAEAYAIGMRNGQPVYPPDPTYQNNAKHYADNAHNSEIISGSYMRMSSDYASAALQFSEDAEDFSIISGSYMNISGSYMNMAQQYSERAGSYMNISASIMNVTGTYADDALDSARKAQSYARGDAVDDQGQPYRPGQENDNAKKYCELAQEAAQQAGALDFEGATETTDGSHGLVPKPFAGDQNKVLYGNGQWNNLPEFQGVNGSILSVSGLLPEAPVGGEKKVFYGKGEWGNLPVFRGVSGSIESIGGMLPPAPQNGEDLVFKGNGQWGMGGNDALIAPVEKTNIATNAYTIGKQFVYGGVLCKAIAAIQIGDTFVLDTNYQLANDITTQIKAIVDAYVTGVKGNSETNYRKGNVNLTSANLGLGTAINNFTITKGNYAAQAMLQTITVDNANNTLNGHRLSLITYNDGLAIWDDTDQQTIWSCRVPLAVTRGGTGATTPAKAKANLSLGTENQNFYITNPSDTNQPLHLRWKDCNTNSDLNGKNLTLAIRKTGISLWNATDSSSVWTLNVPVSIASGGTGVSDLLNLFTTSSVTISSFSVSANSENSKSQAISKTGYYPLAVRELTTLNSCVLTGFSVTEQYVWVKVKNTTSSAITVSPVVTILWIKRT